jgi:hypothetical protein
LLRSVCWILVVVRVSTEVAVQSGQSVIMESCFPQSLLCLMLEEGVATGP